ncbi:MAG: transposase [Anaerolineales bacterium]
MPRNIDSLIQGQYYHIYNRAIAGNVLFREDTNYTYFLARVEKYLLQSAELLAYCLMPNHYHFLLKIVDNNFSSGMQSMAVSYALGYNKFYNQSGHLFQGIFQRKQVNDLNYLLHLSRYIHLNPVKAKLVEHPEEWIYSSYQGYIGISEPKIFDPLPILNIVSDQLQADITTKQMSYQRFIDEWDFDYMDFKVIK